MLERWADTRNQISALEKRVENYKKLMRQYLLRNNLTKYENDMFRVRLTNQNRSFVHKKDVPKEIWDQFAKEKDIEVLTLTEKRARRRT